MLIVKTFKYYAILIRSMQDIIITPKVDSIGRVMIPKHVRDELEIKPGDLVEIIIRSR